ncbi:MAG: amidohydrolase family protein [candidate division KSB1 bacterium]|nr:amidohydrolase family protein [candidate division KSB1 bacterium]MDZ7342705.1 amidohydrolase family protein [candidate division KSB1 bacterium]
MIIDGHAHSCGIFYRAEHIIKILDELRVDKVALCTNFENNDKNQSQSLPYLAKWFPNSDVMLPMNRVIKLVNKMARAKSSLISGNEYVFKLASQHPDRIIQFYWVDPNEPNALREMKAKFFEWRFKGIKFHQPSAQFRFENQALHEIAYFAAEQRLSVFMHLYSQKDVERFILFAQNHLATTFIIAHLIGLELFERKKIKLPNLYFDVSPTPLISDQRILKAIRLFGAEKVMLGSDTPFGKDNLKKNIERVKRLPISQEQQKLILGENFQSLLNRQPEE